MNHRTDKRCEWPLDKPRWELCGKLAVEKRDVQAAESGPYKYVGVWLCQGHLHDLKKQLVPKH